MSDEMLTAMARMSFCQYDSGAGDDGALAFALIKIDGEWLAACSYHAYHAAKADLESADAVDPLRQPATVCVRLDGLADKIAATVEAEIIHPPVFPREGFTRYTCAADAVVALLQSLAVQ